MRQPPASEVPDDPQSSQQTASLPTEFTSHYDFELDGFQRQACQALAAGENVLVCAPTGSGKTVVGEFAIHLALTSGRKAFYTTPIKALSNQKYLDLVARYGNDQVGLLTGDTSINGEAPIVVMTTEVLRNMLYAGSQTVVGLAHVVIDEVHYLADMFRGAVWEEVIIHLPQQVRITALSATVSNAAEFGDWLTSVRGTTLTVRSWRRPVPLQTQLLVGNRMTPLFDAPSQRDVLDVTDDVVPPAPQRISPKAWAFVRPGTKDHRPPRRSLPHRRDGGRPGSTARWQERDRPARERDRSRSERNGGRDRSTQEGKPGKRNRRNDRNSGEPVWQRYRDARQGRTSRPRVVTTLREKSMLPAIVFIFSRAGCDAAVSQCQAAGLQLATPQQITQIEQLAQERCAYLSVAEKHALNYESWLDGLRRGVAAHHAGLIPVFKQVVEQLFSAGLLQVVYATETLALGINMPARTVVIEKLVKYNGFEHADLTPGEFTQLTGRAGRRGKDVTGNAVVVWRGGMDLKQVAGIAAGKRFPLNSSFRPSCNMAVNLVESVGREHASSVLQRSFAQFQADRKPRLHTRSRSIARQFEDVCALLDELGYLAGDEVTAQGRWLRGIYSESDVLISECLRQQVWSGLDAATLAGCVSAIVYESRGDRRGGRPAAALRTPLAAMRRIRDGLAAAQQRYGLLPTRELDDSLATAMSWWASGGDLVEVLDNDVTAGDFVRCCRQCIDVLSHIAHVAADEADTLPDAADVRTVALQAKDAICRGIVIPDIIAEA